MQFSRRHRVENSNVFHANAVPWKEATVKCLSTGEVHRQWLKRESWSIVGHSVGNWFAGRNSWARWTIDETMHVAHTEQKGELIASLSRRRLEARNSNELPRFSHGNMLAQFRSECCGVQLNLEAILANFHRIVNNVACQRGKDPGDRWDVRAKKNDLWNDREK